MQDSKAKPTIEDIKAAIYMDLFGTEYIAQFYALSMVMVSILCAIFIPHSGFFPTSQSEGMTNYHRWMYDQYVIVSCIMGLILYIRLRYKKKDLKFRRLWNKYVSLYTEERFRNYQYAKEHGETTILYTSKIIFYCIILLLIVGLIATYIWMTPFTGTYKSAFWILAWWPVNAFIIMGLYYAQISIFLLFFTIEDTHKYFKKLQNRAKRQSQLSEAD
ncbi:MAG: hypothetical protein Q4F77_03545 [Acinetobacter sp.]|uniref:hypothetical protein n=1 Tax=Acinetobacter sp. TaxID=472 RepID=UPI0026DF5C06|nr:hypothetical protein [Acinetobacter sp.]MDO5542363.1 hypothetical protein [Acinetobacter sp.]